MKHLCCLLLLLVSFGLCSQPEPQLTVKQYAESTSWMTEQYPPYNYVDADNQLRGIAVDVLLELFKRLDIRVDSQDISVYPWARSYKMLQTQPGSCLFSMTYTEERLQEFKFVGPILASRISVMGMRDRGLKINTVDDLHQLSFGVVREDIGDQLLRSLKITPSHTFPLHSADSMIQLLLLGRVDAIVYAEDVARYKFKQAGISEQDYEVLYVLKDSHIGFAFNRNSPQRLINALDESLKKMMSEGVVEKIRRNYIDSAD